GGAEVAASALEELAGKHPSSRLADHVRLRLGHYYESQSDLQPDKATGLRDDKLAARAAASFAAVSGRLPMLRLEALMGRGRLMSAAPPLPREETAALLKEARSLRPLADGTDREEAGKRLGATPGQRLP